MTKWLSLLFAAATPAANWGIWIKQALFIGAVVALLKFFFPSAIPYGFFELWQTHGGPLEWLVASWPILVWAVAFTFFVSAVTLNSRKDNQDAEGYLANGLWVSLRAGVMEEVMFRWLIFMLEMVVVQVADFILGGFLFNHGLVWLIYTSIIAPIADFCTFGMLHGQLGHDTSWIIASALLASNARFRNGHAYQGLLGLVNSWFLGMYFFYLLFTFGLVAAIFVHCVYDIVIFAIGYIDRAQERARNISKDDRR